MGVWEGFFWGLIGGLLAELLGWFRLRHQAPNDLPVWMRTGYYWWVTAAMILAGGVLVVVYIRSNIQMSAIVALNIGASAPLLLGSLVSQTPPIPPGKAD